MGIALPVISTVLSVGATISQGREVRKAGKAEAQQLRQQARADIAASQIDAKAERKRAELLASRLVSIAGASGTSSASPDIINQLAEIDERGAYNSLAALYSGKTSARTKNLAARQREKQGKRAEKQSIFKAGSQVLAAGDQYEWWG